MDISDEGIAAIKVREGVRTRAYQDSRGIWTIGVGHTSAAGPPHVTQGMEITDEQVTNILYTDLREFVDCVNQVVHVPLSQNQFDACCSLAFNIGTSAFANSRVVQYLNAKRYDDAKNAFMNWCHPEELYGRRQSEQRQFDCPDGS